MSLQEMGDMMKGFKIKLSAVLLFCLILGYSGIVFGEGGVYDYSGNFTKQIQQNPLERDYQIEFKAAQTRIDYDMLEGKYIKLWDRELNVIYQKLLSRLSDQQKDILIDAQVGWLEWHTKETKFVNITWMDDRKLGSQGAIQEAKAQKYRLRERTLQLMEYYYLLEHKVEFEYQGITK